MNKFSPMLPLSLGLIVALSGCAASKAVRQAEGAGSNLANQHFDVARKPQKESRSFVVEDTFYAARKPISVTPVNPSVSLPDAFRKSANMDVQSPIALTEIGSRITKITGYPVVVDQDVVSGGSKTRAAAPVAATPPLALPGAGPLPDASSPPGALPPLPTSVELSSAPSDTVLSEVVYRGDLTGLLNEVTGRLNLSWRWTGSRIEIFRYSTQTFRLDAMAGKATSSSKLNTTSSTSSGSGGGSGGSSGNSGNQGSSGSDISISNDLEIWKDVEDNLKQVLSSGGKLSVNTSAGLITVIDTPAVQRQVEALVTEYNRIYSKQVMLNVEVYSVERQKGDNYSLNWDALWSRASSSLGFTFNSAQGGIGGPAFTIDVGGDGPFSGSSVVGQALSTMGNTSLLTSSTAITLNGQTVPLNVSREVAYVQSTSSSISGSDSSLASTTITPGVATEGLAMNFTPRILDNNQVLVRYSIDLSVIEAIEDFSSPNGESAVQLPRRSVRNFLQNVSIPSGQSLVLTGFQQTQATRDGQGPFSASAWWAGGNKRANSTSRTIVIVLTPYVSQR